MKRITKEPDIRRQELLDIGVLLYFKNGEKGMSIQQVVKQANVATGLFYYYFKSKESFLDEALNSYVEKEFKVFEEQLKEQRPIIEKLNSVLDTYFKYAQKMEKYRLDTVFQTTRHYQLTSKLIQRLEKQVTSVLQDGVKENLLKINNIELTTSFILNGLECIFDSNIPIDKTTIKELKSYIYKLIGVQNENIN